MKIILINEYFKRRKKKSIKNILFGGIVAHCVYPQPALIGRHRAKKLCVGNFEKKNW